MKSVDVADHYGLALRLARRRWWMYRVLDREDYEQEAMLALIVARDKFDPSAGNKFVTFAYPCINGALINAERQWIGYSRRSKDSPLLVEIAEDDATSRGMCEADIEGLDGLYEGEWFARPARLYLLAGLSALEVARLCNCKLNTVHQSVSYFRKRLSREAA